MMDFFPRSFVARGAWVRRSVGKWRPQTLLLTAAFTAVACASGHTSEPPPAAPAREAPAVESAPSSDAAGAAAAPNDESKPQSTHPPAPAAGAPMTGSMTKAESDGVRAKSDELDTLDAQFEHAVSLASNDCTTPWALRDRICDLAQRLCDMAERSAEIEVQERCKDGRLRCERATARVRAACAE